MAISALRAPAGSKFDAIDWIRARPLLYFYAVFALWAVVPGLRRVIDWRTAFSSVSIVSIVPLLSLVPAALALVAGRRFAKLDRHLVIAAWMWLGAFAYAYAIGLVTGNAPAATYTFVEFMLPMGFGLYVATLAMDRAELYRRIASFLLALSVPVSLYAFFQYVSPPPWDVFWMRGTGFVTNGLPLPYLIRPFATLNGPAPFADFLIGVLIVNFPRIRDASPFFFAAFALDIGALSLTLVRGDWVGFALAVLVFVALRPNKFRNLSVLGIVTVVFAIVVANAGILFGNSVVGDLLTNRFGSFTTLGTDTSFRDRQQYFGEDLRLAIAQPTGEGLGVVGTAAKLGASEKTADFDNGYIARFVEMGYFGTFIYLATIAAAFVATFRRWRSLDRAGDSRASAVAAAMLALQAALVFLDISFDHHMQLAGLFFWLSLAFVFKRDSA